ncbi:MAG: hypothetical protein Q8O43_07405 [Dehalococcoidia bacterium]|nr:hypothetical protein [Dehalococcoidia bacterium]
MKKLVWLVLDAVLVMVLVLTSCQSAPAPEAEGQSVAGKVAEPEKKSTTEPEKKPVTQVGKVEQKISTTALVPKYGGTLNVSREADVPGFDPKFFIAASEPVAQRLQPSGLMMTLLES